MNTESHIEAGAKPRNWNLQNEKPKSIRSKMQIKEDTKIYLKRKRNKSTLKRRREVGCWFQWVFVGSNF